MNKHSKQMAIDDILFAIVLIVIGFSSFPEQPLGGIIAIIFGALWLGIRIYHLIIFKDDK